MQIQATEHAAAPARPGFAMRPARRVLTMAAALAFVAGLAFVAERRPADVDPDFVRVLRFMAAMKGGFALTALAACYWRLARPAAPWRTALYVAAPPVMVAGAAGMWSLQHLGASALGLHLGLIGVLAAALTDQDFLPRLKLRKGQRL